MSKTRVKGRNVKPIEFKLSYETACSLQSILTQQSIHVGKETSEGLTKEFQEINKFYEALTHYVESN
jgi:hypothetical protein